MQPSGTKFTDKPRLTAELGLDLLTGFSLRSGEER